MTYAEYIQYHKQGDSGAEERMMASLCKHFQLTEWDSFRLIYYYTMTYNIPSALSMLFDSTPKSQLTFRTDRRYVRCNGAYERMLNELSPTMLSNLHKCKTTTEAYKEVVGWFYFGRYAAYLFLEVYCNVFEPYWIDDIKYNWEANENYTKGAISIIGKNDIKELDKFLESVKTDTGDNAFAIETSLCAVAKMNKGTRWNGFYTERMLDEASKSKYNNIILENL